MPHSAQPNVAIKRLDWRASSAEIFGNFSHLPWAMLLDSADAKHQDAQYDILVANPIATIVSHQEHANEKTFQTKINYYDRSFNNEKVTTSDDPFTVLAAVLKEFFPEPLTSDYPFSGGAMGCFNYDLGRAVEVIAETAVDDIPLPAMNIGIYHSALLFERSTKQWILIDCFGEESLKLEYQKIMATLGDNFDGKSGAKINDKLTGEMRPFNLTSNWNHQLSLQEYTDKFNQVQRYLHSGDCYQINLTQRFSARYTGDEWLAYLKLRESNQAPFSSFIRLDDIAILSISPERFIQLDGDQIQTKPIKGTRPRFADSEQDRESAQALSQSEKDRAENLMIVDLLRNDIGKVATAGSVSVPHLFKIESFPAVHHLVSTITATLAPQYSATDLLKAAFPGGSITGAPKIRAMEIIEELEPSRRSLYCGSIGYISQDGKMDTSITIRTIVACSQQQTLYCWAGGGIVADSNVADEYQETFDKVNRILPVLDSKS